ALPRSRHRAEDVHHPRAARPRHLAGADRRAHFHHVLAEAHPDAGQGEHRAERDRPAVLPLLLPQHHPLLPLHLHPPGSTSFLLLLAALALLHTITKTTPFWLSGPYSPVAISSASQPDFYMGILEGALRVMPAWEWNFLGHTITFSVLIPFAVPLGIILGGAA